LGGNSQIALGFILALIFKPTFSSCMNNKLLLLSIFVMLMLLASFVSDKKKKIVFFGDSITQAGVLPSGYISVLKEMLAKDNIDNYELMGAGIGGNKVYDLYLRMEEDVIAKSPDIVVIYVGVNDVWHKRTSGTGTDADKFEKFYRAMIKKFQAANIKVVMATPAVIGERNNCTNPQDGELNQYSDIIRRIAASTRIPLVDLRAKFLEYLATNNPENKDKGILTTDGVHMNDEGNRFLANNMWDVIKEVK
jgi:lysophospholipase L1-like esterase